MQELLQKSEILKASMDAWGSERQVFQCLEELGECIVALAEWKSGRRGPDNFLEEMVDCELLFEQMRYVITGNTEVDEGLVQRKLRKMRAHLQRKLNDSNYKAAREV